MDEDFERLRNEMFDAVFDAGALERALIRLAAIGGATTAQIKACNGAHTIVQSAWSRPVDEAFLALEAEYSPISPRALAVPRMVQGKVYRDRDVIETDLIASNPYYQDFLVPNGMGHWSGVPVIRTQSFTAGLAFHRPLAMEAFSDEEARVHQRAGQVFEPVFRLASLLSEQNNRALLEMFSQDQAAAIVSLHGVLVDQNAAFEAACRAGSVRVAGDRSLKFVSRRSEQDYACARLNLLAGGAFIVRDEDGQAVWKGDLLPMPRQVIALPAAGAFVLVLTGLKPPRRLNVALVRDGFGLTPAEAEVADLMFQGVDLVEISARRGVTLATTRTNVKRILNKADCKRQAELVSVLIPFSRSSGEGEA